MKPIPVFDSNYGYQFVCACNYSNTSIYHAYLLKDNNRRQALQFDTISISPIDPEHTPYHYFARTMYGQTIFTNTNFRTIKKQVLTYLKSTEGMRYLLIQLYHNVNFLKIHNYVIDRRTLERILFKTHEIDNDTL